MNLSTSSAAYSLQSILGLLNNGLLRFYTGTIPVTPETAVTGSLLATYTFSPVAFTNLTLTGGNEQMLASFVTNPVTPSASGTVGYARASIVANAWATSTGYIVNQCVTANGNLYVCTKAGTSNASGTGPATTAFGIVDNAGATSVVWNYIGLASTALAVSDFTVGLTATDIIVGTTAFSNSIPLSISNFAISVPAV